MPCTVQDTADTVMGKTEILALVRCTLPSNEETDSKSNTKNLSDERSGGRMKQGGGM